MPLEYRYGVYPYLRVRVRCHSAQFVLKLKAYLFYLKILLKE